MKEPSSMTDPTSITELVKELQTVLSKQKNGEVLFLDEGSTFQVRDFRILASALLIAVEALEELSDPTPTANRYKKAQQALSRISSLPQ